MALVPRIFAGRYPGETDPRLSISKQGVDVVGTGFGPEDALFDSRFAKTELLLMKGSIAAIGANSNQDYNLQTYDASLVAKFRWVDVSYGATFSYVPLVHIFLRRADGPGGDADKASYFVGGALDRRFGANFVGAGNNVWYGIEYPMCFVVASASGFRFYNSKYGDPARYAVYAVEVK